MKNLKNIEVKSIVVEAQAGTHLTEALWDAMELAVMNREVVELDFNSKTITIDPKLMFQSLMAQHQ